MYLGFQGLRVLSKALPLGIARSTGRALGAVAYKVLRSQRELTITHLAYALNDSLSPSQRERVARNVFINLGQTALEWLRLSQYSLSDVQRMITCEGLEHLRQALAQGRGAILIGGHFGNWELVPIYLKSLGFEGGVLARRLRYPEYESFLIAMRRRLGVVTFARGSLKDVAKVLRANQIIGMLPDQDIDSLEGVFVDFFGHPAHTPIGPAALSVMTGAPLIPCALIREGARFRLFIEPPIPHPQTADRAQALQRITQQWSDVLASYVRRYPEQWVWMHRRWKTQPSTSNVAVPPAPSSSSHPTPASRAPCAQPVLPLVLLSACSLLLSGVVGCAKPGGSKPASEQTASEGSTTAGSNVTEQMSEFTLTGYEPDGDKRWELNGRGATVEDHIVTILRPDAIGYDPIRQAYLTASAAQVDQMTRHVRLEHDVTIHTSDGLWLTSPVLHWIPDRDELATDQPVRIETDHMLLRGRGATSLMKLKQATLLHDIEMVLNPRDHEPSTGAQQATITCDGPLSFDYEHNIATFERNVHVKDPSGDLYSDTLVAYFDGATRTIRYAEAVGHVQIHQHGNTAASERAVYEPTMGKITLVGKPSLLIYPSQDGAGTATPLQIGGLAAAPAEKP